MRPTSHRIEKRREERREERNIRLNITSGSDFRDRQQGTAGSNPPLTDSFRVGERVRHHAFGPGHVLAVKPSGADQEVTVMFQSVGTKRLLASLAKLEKI
jgi:hypothetical protein